FPITQFQSVNYTLTFFNDSSGTATRAIFHVKEQDVFTANGKSLTGSVYSFNLMAPVNSDGSFGEITSGGVILKVPLPDGSLFITAGQGTLNPTTGLIFFPDHGATVNLAGFCAALAP